MTSLLSHADHAIIRYPVRVAGRLIQHLRAAWRRHCYRRQISYLLAAKSPLLRDIGMTIPEAESEARAPVWQSEYLPPLRHF